MSAREIIGNSKQGRVRTSALYFSVSFVASFSSQNVGQVRDWGRFYFCILERYLLGNFGD